MATIESQIESGDRHNASEISVLDVGMMFGNSQGFVEDKHIGRLVWLKTWGLMVETHEDRVRRKQKAPKGG